MKPYTQRIDFNFSSGSDSQRLNDLESELTQCGYSIVCSTSIHNADRMAEAKELLKENYNAGESTVLLYAAQGLDNRIIIVDGWQAIVSSHDQESLLRFSTRFTCDTSRALKSYNPRTSDSNAKSPWRWRPILATIVAGVAPLVSRLFEGSLGWVSTAFAILVIISMGIYSALTQRQM